MAFGKSVASDGIWRYFASQRQPLYFQRSGEGWSAVRDAGARIDGYLFAGFGFAVRPMNGVEGKNERKKQLLVVITVRASWGAVRRRGRFCKRLCTFS